MRQKFQNRAGKSNTLENYDINPFLLPKIGTTVETETVATALLL